MADRAMGGHQSARMGKDEWLTPPHVIDALGPFALDPCAPIDRPWDTAERHYTISDDGLHQPWSGLVWCNPPYGQHVWRWLDRLSRHPDGGIALIFARTETAGFHAHVWESATALLFLRGRLHFHHVDGSRAKANAGAPSVLVAYGAEATARLEECALDGHFVRLARWTRG